MQHRAIEALLQGNNASQVATSLELNRATITSWINDDVFSAELRTQQNALYATGLGLLLSQLDASIGNVIALSVNAEDEGIRLRANVALIDKLLQLRNQNDLEQRLAKLEALIAQQPENRNN